VLPVRRYKAFFEDIFSENKIFQFTHDIQRPFLGSRRGIVKKNRGFSLAQGGLQNPPSFLQNTFWMRRQKLCPNTYFSTRTEQEVTIS